MHKVFFKVVSKKFMKDKNISKNTIFIGADHAGFKLKEKIKEIITEKGYDCIDMGNKKYTPGDDYPDHAKSVAVKVSGTGSRGILVCDSGVGVCIAANKIHGIRAVNACSTKMAKMSRLHNGSNILCLGQDYLDPEQAEEIIKTWLETGFSPEERHHRRISKITRMER